MTPEQDKKIRLFFFLASLPFLYFLFSKAEHNWLYYLSLALILAGVVYGIVSDWKQGKRAQVKKRLLIYGVFIVILIIIAVVRGDGN